MNCPLLAITYLAAARWLQQRSAWLRSSDGVDAIYIVAGAPKSPQRVGAVLDWAHAHDCRGVTILGTTHNSHNSRNASIDIPRSPTYNAA